jgi:hypothetical protein
MTAIDQLVTTLRSCRFRFQSEAELQSGIAEALTTAEIPFDREVRLSPLDRVDFLCGSIGLEAKVKGSLAEVTRQVHRYCQHDTISAVVLVTTKANHRDLPAAMNQKAVTTLWLGFQEAF